jgi:MFS family permease
MRAAHAEAAQGAFVPPTQTGSNPLPSGDDQMTAAVVGTGKQQHWWLVVVAAASLLMITMGARQSLGLFVSPLNTSTGLGIVTISFAMAVGQFVWGAVQPIAGAVADRYGPGRVLVAGVLVMAVGTALTPYMDSGLGMVLTLGVLMAAGSGAGSFSVLIGAAAQRVPAASRGTAAGVINAGGSFGQVVFAPLAQKLIGLSGVFGMTWLAAISLLALPLARLLRRSPEAAAAHAVASTRRRGHSCRRADRDGGPQLPAAACRLLHLRLPHRLPGDASARRSEPVRAAGERGQLVAGDHRSGQHCRLADGRGGGSTATAAR